MTPTKKIYSEEEFERMSDRHKTIANLTDYGWCMEWDKVAGKFRKYYAAARKAEAERASKR